MLSSGFTVVTYLIKAKKVYKYIKTANIRLNILNFLYSKELNL